MGTEVGRIEKEFVFKSLVDEGAECDLHGARKEVRCTFHAAEGDTLELAPVTGQLDGFETGEEVRIFFYLKNNYHTFVTHVLETGTDKIVLEHPPGVYKNLQRKYERVKARGDIEVYFTLEGTKVELNFPKSDRFSPVDPPEKSETFDPKRIQEVVKTFRLTMENRTSENKIVMLRDKMPRSWEEKTIVRTGKSLWIPSTEEDFPQRDPFPDERVVTKGELIKLEEGSGAQAYVVNSRLGNILYEKSKQGIFSELWCPMLYNEYVVGYLKVWNTHERKEKVSREIMETVQEFARVLCYSLVTNGYFKVENVTARRYEAPIIDISASGLLFAHTSPDLIRDLLVHSDLELSVRLEKRTLQVGARVMRKFKDAENAYFGVLFLRLEQEDFQFLFEFLYGKEFDPSQEGTWEGGAPPPPLDMS
jgi:hypothetical protein